MVAATIALPGWIPPNQDIKSSAHPRAETKGDYIGFEETPDQPKLDIYLFLSVLHQALSSTSVCILTTKIR